MDDVQMLDAVGQAELVRRRIISPLELVNHAISRIEELNPNLNAVVTPMFEYAQQAAQEPLPEGPLAGVPYVLKDLGPTFAGIRHTCGSRLLATYISDRDSALVTRIKASGLIVIGKTNTPEFGNSSTTESLLFGPCRNPWSLDRSPGGSSGGSAVAVAAGMVPAAHANDAGGSIRIPASCCGVFGLKPTRGRVASSPSTVGGAILACEHAITRSVRDSAVLLDILGGAAPGDLYVAPAAKRPFSHEVGADPGRLRIAWCSTAPSSTPVHEDCRRAAHEAALLLERLGHTVEEDAPSIDVERFEHLVFVLWTTSIAAAIESWVARAGATDDALLEPVNQKMEEWARRINAVDYMHALGDLEQFARTMALFFKRYDIWLTPTLAQPPVPLGTFDLPAEDIDRFFEIDARLTPWTALANLTGQPAASIPFLWTMDELPVGVHLLSRFGDEAALLRLCSQLEAARPWHESWPRASPKNSSPVDSHGTYIRNAAQPRAK
jgi:amidase